MNRFSLMNTLFLYSSSLVRVMRSTLLLVPVIEPASEMSAYTLAAEKDAIEFFSSLSRISAFILLRSVAISEAFKIMGLKNEAMTSAPTEKFALAPWV